MGAMASWKVWIISALFAVLLTDRFTNAIAFRREDITTTLRPHLSSEAQIILPNDAGFVQATQRWSLFDPPRFTAVVEVGTEEDVATTVSLSILIPTNSTQVMANVNVGQIR